MLHYQHSIMPPQDRHNACTDARRVKRDAGGECGAVGHGAKVAAVLEETCCEFDELFAVTQLKVLLNSQRKCWWDATEVEVPSANGQATQTLRVWARRIWTLETTLLSSPFASSTPL